MNLRANLFWDVDFQKLDKKRDAEFIIGRVLDFGNLKEWKEINNLYNALTIKKVAQKHILTDPRSANFWSKILLLTMQKIQQCQNLSSL